ncbi:hypothetical protein AVEN_156578-1, partial [Araneus ventricosus]
GSPSLGEYVCLNPEESRDLFSLHFQPSLRLLLSADPFHPSTESERWKGRHSVCFLLLIDSQNLTYWPCVATH